MGTPIEKKQPQCLCCTNKRGTDWYIVEDGTTIKYELSKLLQQYGEETVQSGLLCSHCRNKLTSITEMSQQFYNLYKGNCLVQTGRGHMIENNEDIGISKNGPIVKSALLDTYLTGKPTILTDSIQLILDYKCKSIHYNLEEFRLQGLFCDVNIVTEDGSKFKAHSSVLAASSVVLRQALYNRQLPVDLTLPSVSSFSWNLILQFIYTSQIIITSTSRKKKCLQGLFNAATWLNIAELTGLLKMYAPVFVRPDFVFTLPKQRKLLVNTCKNISIAVQTQPFLFAEDNTCHKKDSIEIDVSRSLSRIASNCFSNAREKCHDGVLISSKESNIKNSNNVNEMSKVLESDTDEDNIQSTKVCVVTLKPQDKGEKLKTDNKVLSPGKVKELKKSCDIKGVKRKSLKNNSKMEKQYKCINEDCNTLCVKQNELIKHLKNCLTGDQFNDPVKLIERMGNQYKLIDDLSPIPETQNSKFVQYPVFEMVNKVLKIGSKEYKHYYHCLHCDQKEGGYKRMVDHIANVHRKSKAYVCRKCDKRFYGLSELKDHFLRYHTASSYIKCEECEEIFKCKDTLRVHKKSEHVNVDEQGVPLRKHKCEWCQKSFKMLHHKKMHEKFHLKNDEKPFQCDHCKKRFVSKAAMVEHTRMHTGEKPFKCKYCSFSTARSTNLRFHERTHGYMNAKYKCLSCTKLFLRRENFQVHLMKTGHTGKRVHTKDIGETNNAVSRKRKCIDNKPTSASETINVANLKSIKLSKSARVTLSGNQMSAPVQTNVEKDTNVTTQSTSESEVTRIDGKVGYSCEYRNMVMGKEDTFLQQHDLYKQSTCSTSVPPESMSFLQQLESADPPQIHMSSTVDNIQREIIPKVVLQYHCQESTPDHQHSNSPTCMEVTNQQLSATQFYCAKSSNMQYQQVYSNEIAHTSPMQSIRKINIFSQVIDDNLEKRNNWIQNNNSNVTNTQQDISSVSSERIIQGNIAGHEQYRIGHCEQDHNFYNVCNTRHLGITDNKTQNNTEINLEAESSQSKNSCESSHHNKTLITCEIGNKTECGKIDKQMEQLIHDSMSLENLAQSFHRKNSENKAPKEK